MPKLTPIQWTIVAVFQLFYGFAVFALTRDHYQRRAPIQVSTAAPATPHGSVRPSALPPPSTSAIPDSVVQNDPILLAQMGDERFGQGRYQEAIQIYRRVLELDPEDVDTHNDLGLALHYSGDSEQAVEMLKQGATKDPGFQRIWLTLGFVMSHTADRAGSAEALRRAQELGPDNTVGKEAARMLETVQKGL